MNHRPAVIAAALSLMPLGQPLVSGTGAALTTSSESLLSVDELKRCSSSIADYSKAIELDPKIADAHNRVHIFPHEFSGGQRQRIALARAFYHNKDVLVMDEATSSLDNFTEKQIMNSIKKLRKKHTIIMIAHRLSLSLIHI